MLNRGGFDKVLIAKLLQKLATVQEGDWLTNKIVNEGNKLDGNLVAAKKSGNFKWILDKYVDGEAKS